MWSGVQPASVALVRSRAEKGRVWECRLASGPAVSLRVSGDGGNDLRP